MAKKFKNPDELFKFADELTKKDSDDIIELRIGMGTCGIAAGADKVYEVFQKEVEKRGLKNVVVKKVGCLGLCFSEPNVEVVMKDLPNVLYGYVDEKFAIRILEEHVEGKKVLHENILDKPYQDIYEEEEVK